METLPLAAPAHDMSIYGLFMQAGWIVKAVMIGLLAASIWSESLTTALDLAARIRAGVVWVNGTNLLDAAAPFGGIKESGVGREGGFTGIDEFLETKYIGVRMG